MGYIDYIARNFFFMGHDRRFCEIPITSRELSNRLYKDTSGIVDCSINAVL